MDGLVKRCQVEARRCRAAVAKGSPVDFWRWRLNGLLEKLDSARRVVQSCVDELPGGSGSHLEALSKFSGGPCGDGDGDPGPSSQRRYESDYEPGEEPTRG